MSKLKELIHKLCPDGVEYVQLSEVAKCEKAKNKYHITENAYSITQRGLIPTNEYFGEKTKITSANTSGYYLVEKYWFVYSPSRIDVGSIDYLHDDGPVIVSPLDVVFSINQNKILPDFLLVFLCSHQGMFQILNLRQGIEGTGRKTLPFSQFGKVKIPVPPLPVQEEIVRILDSFTELTAELTAELIARKKQYEYYRDKLLLDTRELSEIKLCDICTIKGRIGFRGYTQADFVDQGNGAVSLSPGNIENHHLTLQQCKYISFSKYEESPEIMVYNNDIVFCKTGSTVGKVAIVENLKEKTTINPQLVVLKNPRCNVRYLFYQLTTHKIQKQVKALAGIGSVPNISQKAFGDMSISVPPLAEQERIVAILDRFDALCNDLTSGLPAEIEARQKQHEYYRDKLLTFQPIAG